MPGPRLLDRAADAGAGATVAPTSRSALDRADFAAWYRAAHPGLAEAVLRTVRPPSLAADAVDEAFARAFARWDRVQAMDSPAGWVYRVAVNEARRQLRRATREDALVALRPPSSSTPPPGGEVWLLVGELPIRQRAAVVLRHVAGLTEAEVGEALGVTRSTVSSSLTAAYRSLASALTAGHDGDGPKDRRTLAVARVCRLDGCDVESLTGGSRSSVPYSGAMRNTIKVRPGDLVALDPSGPTVVWRWWAGLVETVDGADAGNIVVSRNVTQSGPDDPRRSTMAVEVPDELAGAVEPGDTVWFSHEEGHKVVVAVQGRG